MLNDVFETSQRRHGKSIFFEIFSRRLKDVTQKTSFMRCIWDVLKTLQKSHLFWDVPKKYLRCLSQWRFERDLSGTSHTCWCKSNINNQKSIWFCSRQFIKIHKVLNVIMWYMIICNLLIFIAKQRVEFSLILFGTAKRDCVMKIREIFNFLPLKINSVTIGLIFLLLSISAIISSNTINIPVFYLECIL